jgi:hypothetical protein
VLQSLKGQGRSRHTYLTCKKKQESKKQSSVTYDFMPVTAGKDDTKSRHSTVHVQQIGPNSLIDRRLLREDECLRKM